MDKFKKNITIFLLLTTTFCITMFLAYSLYSSVNSFERLSKTFINNTISNAAERCDTWLDNKIELAKGLAGYINIQQPSEIFKYQNYFLNAVESYKFMDITVGFEDGTIAAGMPEGLPAGYDHRERSWYINAIKKNAPYISEPYIDATTGFPCITVCTPIKINNRTAGIFSFDLDFSGLDYIMFNKAYAISGEYPMLITSQGEIIIHERKDYTLKNITALSPAYSQIVSFIQDSANNGKQLALSNNGINKLIIFKKLNYNDWYILYELPADIVGEEKTNIKIFAVILALIASAALITTLIYISKKSA